MARIQKTDKAAEIGRAYAQTADDQVDAHGSVAESYRAYHENGRETRKSMADEDAFDIAFAAEMMNLSGMDYDEMWGAE